MCNCIDVVDKDEDEAEAVEDDKLFNKNVLKIGREPWSSGYGRRIMFKRLWARILLPYTGWTWHFFTLICCISFVVSLKRLKTSKKEARGWPNFKNVFKIYIFPKKLLKLVPEYVGTNCLNWYPSMWRLCFKLIWPQFVIPKMSVWFLLQIEENFVLYESAQIETDQVKAFYNVLVKPYQVSKIVKLAWQGQRKFVPDRPF